MGDLGPLPADGEAVVLRRDQHLAGSPLEHRVVRASMAERQLRRREAGGEAEQLMPQADAEDWHAAEQPRDLGDLRCERRRVARPVREQDAVGTRLEHVVRGRIVRQNRSPSRRPRRAGARSSAWRRSRGGRSWSARCPRCTSRASRPERPARAPPFPDGPEPRRGRCSRHPRRPRRPLSSRPPRAARERRCACRCPRAQQLRAPRAIGTTPSRRHGASTRHGQRRRPIRCARRRRRSCRPSEP